MSTVYLKFTELPREGASFGTTYIERVDGVGITPEEFLAQQREAIKGDNWIVDLSDAEAYRTTQGQTTKSRGDGTSTPAQPPKLNCLGDPEETVYVMLQHQFMSRPALRRIGVQHVDFTETFDHKGLSRRWIRTAEIVSLEVKPPESDPS